MSDSRGPAGEAISRYRKLRPKIDAGARVVAQLLTGCLDDAGVNYLSASARAKTVESFARKASRPHRDKPDQLRYTDPLNQITDLLGARVITYLPETVNRACELVHEEFEVMEEEDKGQRLKDRGAFGYASRHFLVRLKTPRAELLEYKMLHGRIFEIQVRTAVQHAWAEFEHDVRYKAAIPKERLAEFNRRFTLAAALIELADAEFTAIDELFSSVAQETLETPTAVVALDEAALTAWAEERYPESQRSRREHYRWMLEVLDSLGMHTIGELNARLARTDSAAVAEAMTHQFPAGHVRRLDDDLLSALGEAYIANCGDGQRQRMLRSRWDRLR